MMMVVVMAVVYHHDARAAGPEYIHRALIADGKTGVYSVRGPNTPVRAMEVRRRPNVTEFG